MLKETHHEGGVLCNFLMTPLIIISANFYVGPLSDKIILIISSLLITTYITDIASRFPDWDLAETSNPESEREVFINTLAVRVYKEVRKRQGSHRSRATHTLSIYVNYFILCPLVIRVFCDFIPFLTNHFLFTISTSFGLACAVHCIFDAFNYSGCYLTPSSDETKHFVPNRDKTIFRSFKKISRDGYGVTGGDYEEFFTHKVRGMNGKVTMIIIVVITYTVVSELTGSDFLATIWEWVK